jgi:nitrate reductase NapAB chaperone NapD
MSQHYHDSACRDSALENIVSELDMIDNRLVQLSELTARLVLVLEATLDAAGRDRLRDLESER